MSSDSCVELGVIDFSLGPRGLSYPRTGPDLPIGTLDLVSKRGHWERVPYKGKVCI